MLLGKFEKLNEIVHRFIIYIVLYVKKECIHPKGRGHKTWCQYLWIGKRNQYKIISYRNLNCANLLESNCLFLISRFTYNQNYP